ncbi:MAG: chemotaxis protein CheW [Gammaproteobacteria bacterium]|nr:MAG: chemotaxis protein CheW [Gammaproteobacteria bacterium]
MREKIISTPVIKNEIRTPVIKAAVSRKVESSRSPEYAEPDADKKEKLQKLLSSAQPHIVVAPIVKVKTSFVENPREIQEWVIETAAPVVETRTLETPAVIESELVSQQFQMPGLEWLPNGLPQWAQSRFDVLLFKVSGLTLAVPLISLGQIQPITDELTPLFGQADWFMGFQPTPQGKIRTVNTAKFVMPERYDENFVKNAKYVVSINGVPWGLAVDSVNQPISLKPDDVKWRTDRSKRPWLAGTVKEHMCALLDIPMIGQMLMDADKNALKSRA